MKNTRKKLPIFDILLTSLTLVLILTSVYLLYSYKNNSSAAYNSPDDIASTIDEAESSFAGIKIVTEISNDPTVPFAIQYPQSNHTAFNDKVKKFIKAIKYDHLTTVSTYREQQKNVPNELNISFETFEHSNGAYSFVFVTNKHIGEQLGDMKIDTFHLDHETGEMLTLQELLNHDEKNFEQLAMFAKKYLTEDETLSEKLTDEDIDTLTESLWDKEQHFALTEEALVLYFPVEQNQGNIAIVPLTYHDINHLLIDAYQIDEDKLAEESQPNSDLPEEESTDTNEADQTEEQTEEVPTGKRVALTFDDGPDPDVTTRVLKILERHDAKATFFMLGSRVEYYPEIAKMVQEAGHELGNHSWTHPDLTKATTDKVFDEIHRTSEIIESVTGERPYSFRPPYGAFNEHVQAQTELPIALWDVDTLDWKHRNPQQLLTYVQNSVRDGSIILMHDIHPSTADGLDAVLTYLKENDYTFVTVSEMESQ